MANRRVSKAQRVKTSIVAEREIRRYAGDHALWCKHVLGVDLDSMQILKCVEMEEHPNTIDFSCRRVGKTVVKALYQLMFNALNRDQELGIVAPREQQAMNNLRYHTDQIRGSPILRAYMGYKSGREQMSDSYYEFANRSCCQSYGIMSQVDGGDLTHADLEEVDDMPQDRLFSRFMLMMAGTRRLGADKGAVNDPQVRITGVFKGADTLSRLISSGHYHILPIVNVYLGVELELLNREYVEQMRSELAADEFIRQMLCKNVSARHFIWEAHVRRAMTLGLRAGFDIAEPVPGHQYKKRGVVAFGFDAGAHGENPNSSQNALVVIEEIQGWRFFCYVRTWPAHYPEPELMEEIASLWAYFRPDYAIGDAFGVGMITSLNDRLFKMGLTSVDRRTVNEGESTASSWSDWAFSPMRFDGMVKHQMATSLRSKFANNRVVIPFFDPDDPGVTVADFTTFARQLPNVRAEPTKRPYSKYIQADDSVGDDLFDAAMAAEWALVTRGLADSGTILLPGQPRTSESIVGRGLPFLSDDYSRG